MIYTGQFSAWLNLAAQDGRGGLSAQLPSIVRGQTRDYTLSLGEHPVYGDWTDGEFTCRVKASPDAADPGLAEWTITIGTPVDGVTPITFSLLGSAHTDIPVDGDGDGVTDLLMQIDYTPSAGASDALIQTMIFFVGDV